MTNPPQPPLGATPSATPEPSASDRERIATFLRGKAMLSMHEPFAKDYEMAADLILANTPSAEWIKSDRIEQPGYYWCRLGPTDEKPLIVLINHPEEDSDLLVYEFSDNRGQQLAAYGGEWQFMPVDRRAALAELFLQSAPDLQRELSTARAALAQCEERVKHLQSVKKEEYDNRGAIQHEINECDLLGMPDDQAEAVAFIVAAHAKALEDGRRATAVLTAIKDRVNASDDFSADEIIEMIDKVVGRFSQGVDWAEGALMRELSVDLGESNERTARISAAATRLMASLKTLGKLKGGKTLFEGSPLADSECHAAWLELHDARQAVTAALAASAPATGGKGGAV